MSLVAEDTRTMASAVVSREDDSEDQSTLRGSDMRGCGKLYDTQDLKLSPSPSFPHFGGER